ncbi:substrate-binding periplasmic protein [Thalassotalea montiporae]
MKHRSQLTLKLFTLLASMLLAFKAISAEPKLAKIDVLVEDAYPLQYMHRGNYQGLMAEQVKSVLQKANLGEYQFKLIPWPRAVEQAKTAPNTLIVGLARTPSREQDYQWVTPVVSLDYNFYSTAQVMQSKEITEHSIKSMRVGTVINSMLDQHLRASGFTQIHAVPFAEQNFDKLMNNRIDVIPASSSHFMESCVLTRHDCHRFVKVLPVDIETKTLWLAASQTTHKELIKRLREAAQVKPPLLP